jgi:hypothetical protein
MFYGKKPMSYLEEKNLKDIIESEIYTTILDFINVMTEKKGASSKLQERVAKEFLFGLQEVIKQTVTNTIDNYLAMKSEQKMREKLKTRKNLEIE